jgi:hypothetical protein
VSAAELIVENGGGYDEWMNPLVASNSSAALINAVDVSGMDQGAAPSGRGPINEYIWFDLPSAGRVGQVIANQLSALRPSLARYVYSTAAGFAADITGLAGKLADIRNQYAGTPIALADPVPDRGRRPGGHGTARTRCRYRPGQGRTGRRTGRDSGGDQRRSGGGGDLQQSTDHAGD